MCGRYTLRRLDVFLHEMANLRGAIGDIEAGFEIDPRDEPFDEKGKLLSSRFNIAPSQQIPVIRSKSDGAFALGLVKWGLIPSWTKGKPKLQPINARGETVATSGMFRQAFERRRCLIPADGFYEWKKLDAKTKQPMFIHLRGDRPFAFAGLWERWRPDENSDPIDTCTILTTTPNEVMKEIHDRMPVILAPDDFANWLNRDVPGKDVIDLVKPFDAEQMEAWPVSTAVNSPKNDGEELVEKA
jgi:putative SOS response-associated peptidase YedK